MASCESMETGLRFPATPKPTREAELSALLSLSGSASMGRAPITVTPKSILSNHSKSTQEQREELQDLLSYIDGITFATPHHKSQPTRKSLFSGEEEDGEVHFKPPKMTPPPPQPTSIMKPNILGDRTNSRSVNFTASVIKAKPSKLSTAFATPARPSNNTSRKDPTPSRLRFLHDALIKQEDAMENIPQSLPFSLVNHLDEHNQFQTDCESTVDESLIVELSHSGDNNNAIVEDVPQKRDQPGCTPFRPNHRLPRTPDPPVEDSRLTLNTSTEDSILQAVDPEPTHMRRQEVDESIFMGSPFVDRDLLQHRDQSHLTTHFDQASYYERLAENSEQGTSNFMVDGDGWDINNQDVSTSTLNPNLPMNEESVHGGQSVLPPEVELSIIEGLNSDSPRTQRQARELLRSAVESLREARSEREAARKWAADMKEAVNRWAEEQRKLIHCETSARIGTLEENEQQLRIQAFTLENLQTLLQSLHDNFHSSSSERKESEEALKELIMRQQERIEGLSRQIESMGQAVSEGISVQHRGTPKSSSSLMSPDPSTTERRRGRSVVHNIVDKKQTGGSIGGASEVSTNSKRIKESLPNGRGYVIKYSNGVQKEVHKDGTTVVRFSNGDIETDFAKSGTLAYFHAADQVLQITTPDKSILFEYPNGQIERHYPNGTKAILYPDGTKAKIAPDGKVETYHRV